MPRRSSDRVQIAIRVPKEWLAKADELARRISPPGALMSQTDAFRAAIEAGFTALETASFAAAPPEKPRKR